MIDNDEIDDFGIDIDTLLVGMFFVALATIYIVIWLLKKLMEVD